MMISFQRGAMPVLPVTNSSTRITTLCNSTDSHVWRYEWRGEYGYYMPLVGVAGLDDRWVKPA